MSASPEVMQHAARKRRATATERAPCKRSRHDATTSAMAEIEQILESYEAQAPNVCADTSCTSVWLALNVVLDHSTFQKSLLAHDLSSRMQNNVVPVVSRAYEESYMHECMHEHDKPCNMGQYCECQFIDEQHPFVGVAFVMPQIDSEDLGMCILCLRKLTMMLFYRVQKGG
jgi:hypothetical protein